MQMAMSFKTALVFLGILSVFLVMRNFSSLRYALSPDSTAVSQKVLSRQAAQAMKDANYVTLHSLRHRPRPPIRAPSLRVSSADRKKLPARPFSGLGRPVMHGRECILPSSGAGSWRQVVAKDLEIIRTKPPSTTKSCERRGDALIFTLDLKTATKAGGNAWEMSFPHYIVADESGSWRRQRSTLQLFTLDEKGAFHPMGPPHSKHSVISEKGNGAYSHWRHAQTAGLRSASALRFSTKGNVPLEKVVGIVAVAFPMAPHLGWIEFPLGKPKGHQELFREMFLQTFPTVGVSKPSLIEKPSDVVEGTHYLWRVGGNGEFELPLKEGQLYEKVLPHQIAEWYSEFEEKGGILYPPPGSYVYYQNKVGLAKLFQQAQIKTPRTWVIESMADATAKASEIKFPVVIKDPYGFSSLGILQAQDEEEFLTNMKKYFDVARPDVEALVQSKVIALREARVTYIEGRPFHGYWRIRQSIKSATAASNFGGYQDFNFPLEDIAPYVAEFANKTGIPVGGVDFIWQEENPDVKTTPFTLEVSPTSDINPPAPASWTKTYAEFKHAPGYHQAFLEVRRQWADLMTLAVIDRYRREKQHLFVDIDNVVSRSMDRVRRHAGGKEAYSAAEVMKDKPVEGAVEALQKLRDRYFIRFLTARGSYEDPFNVTQTWLDHQGFVYDDLLVVDGPESKVAHMSNETILVDDFTLGHEKEKPFMNQKFMDQLRAAGLPFIVFPLGGSWDDVMPKLLPDGNTASI
eukprot:TRINITY_DN73684_c0_g1_i1.p1 TRINITY_DN73684_c0_g1~~TRINITY_DN73684_c0_g1_i1.p1  ORF type:complete len:745 (-),score=122.23 TRINITY_DN73684_c0_g1_i1:17-2251(-)